MAHTSSSRNKLAFVAALLATIDDAGAFQLGQQQQQQQQHAVASSPPRIHQRHHNGVSGLPIVFAASGSDNDDWQQDTTPGLNGSGKRPSKSDLYSTEELENLLNIHESLTKSSTAREENDNPLPSLHELVVQTLAEEEVAAEPTSTKYQALLDDEEMKETIRNICVIASDLDGTLIPSQEPRALHPRTQSAIRQALDDSETVFFAATGKSRAGALASLGEEFGALLSKQPGVFIQGLYCVDASGKVVYEKKLRPDQVQAAAAFAIDNNLSVFGYDGDNLYATTASDPVLIQEFHDIYKEPLAQSIDSLTNHEPGFHKVLFMDHDIDKLKSYYRPKLDAVAAELDCCVTQAIPTMLELLPPNSSKGVGVQALCEALGFDPQSQLLAIGDAENDLDNLQLAALGVAVGNALPNVKEAADIVLEEAAGEGGAGIAIELFGLGKILND